MISACTIRKAKPIKGPNYNNNNNGSTYRYSLELTSNSWHCLAILRGLGFAAILLLT